MMTWLLSLVCVEYASPPFSCLSLFSIDHPPPLTSSLDLQRRGFVQDLATTILYNLRLSDLATVPKFATTNRTYHPKHRVSRAATRELSCPLGPNHR
jgi:hypothetical protein